MKPSTRAKIWYVLPTMNLGGAEKHVVSLAGALRKRGYETGIVTIFQEGTLASEIQREGIPFVCLHASRDWRLSTFHSLWKWMRSTPVDILHTYLFSFHFFAGFPARLSKVPVILSSRREIASWRRGRHLFLENLGNLFVDRVVCCSRAVQRWTLEKERIDPDKTLTIYNGVDLDRFDASRNGKEIRREFGIPDGVPLVGTVANFSFEKGYPYLVKAMALILVKNPKVWFLLVGAGPFQEEVRREVQNIPRHEQVIFAGVRSDIPDLVGAMDLFTLASVTEGFPNVVLEAMAMAKPVVATAVGGIPELIQTGGDGILVPAKDGQALARAILSLLNDSQTASQLGSAASEKVRRQYTLNRMVDDYEALYRSFLKGKHEMEREKDSAMAVKTPLLSLTP